MRPDRDLTEHEIHVIERRPVCATCHLPMTTESRDRPLRCTTPGCPVADWWAATGEAELYADRQDFQALLGAPVDWPPTSRHDPGSFERGLGYALLGVGMLAGAAAGVGFIVWRVVT